MEKFEVGKRYEMRSICDHDCVWRYTVIARTEKTIWLESKRGEKIMCRINTRDTAYFDCECVRPLGTYSMCPILRADNIINDKF
jgi:hypothetical protein